MGQSSSTERRRRRRSSRMNNNYPQSQPLPLPPPTYPYAPNPSSYPTPYPVPPPPPPQYNPNSFSNQLTMGYNSILRFVDSLMGRTQYPPHYYAQNQGSGWMVSPPPPPPPPPPTTTTTISSSSSGVNTPQVIPQYVEHQSAKTVKNDVNVHKDTIRLQADEENPDQHLVSFVFDAMEDGSVTVYYFAQEGINCNFSPVYEDFFTPKTFPLQKGFGQKFLQSSGSGIDLGFFELDHLSKPMKGDVFPLVIYAQGATCTQITQAVIERSNKNGSFKPKVMKQILWTNGERYELQEIFGIEASTSTEAEAATSDPNGDDSGQDCVICLSEPRNTAVLPCRHMCMCSECAKALRLQSNNCPICRQPVEQLMEIKVNKDEH